MTVRPIEVQLASLEDDILDSLGYREFTVEVGSTVISPNPEVVDTPKKNIPTAAYQGYLQVLGGNGHPTNFFNIAISREVPEATIRQAEYWTLTRDTYVAQGLPVEIVVQDSRYLVMVAIIKRIS